MPLYFLLHDAATFHNQVKPALAAAWCQRSFTPCQELCAGLLPAVRAFGERYHTAPEESLLFQVVGGLHFGRDYWRLLVSEVLLYGAVEIPELEIAPDTLLCLLAPERFVTEAVPRERFVPIQQAHYGSRDLVFGGGFYRPEHAGYNDTDDVARLATYLAGIDPRRWNPADLHPMPDLTQDEDRAEELEYTREWLPALRDLYQGAHAKSQLVVCEML